MNAPDGPRMRSAMQMSDFLPRFNPAARIEAVPLHPQHLPGQLCLVVDDLLLNPEALVELAVVWRAHFQDPHASAYPGLELLPLAMSPQVAAMRAAAIDGACGP